MCIDGKRALFKFFDNDKDFNKVKASIYEVCEFLHDIIKIENLNLIFHFHIKLEFIIHAMDIEF